MQSEGSSAIKVKFTRVHPIFAGYSHKKRPDFVLVLVHAQQEQENELEREVVCKD